jgi:CRP/FNR family transcriptional regulator, cyclic AMP receptor protein
VESPLLAVLADEDRRELLRLARRRRFARGEVIFHEGDPGDTLHLLAQGHVAVRAATPLGDIAMLRVLRPGEFFGELAVVSPGPRNATVVALDRVETLGIAKQQLDELRSRRPAVDAVVTEALANEIRRLAAALTEALYLPSEKRLLRRLVDLVALFGTDTNPATVIPLTQDELAQLAGVTRPTANRILKKAEEDGTMRISRGRVEILDSEALVRQAR